MANEKKQLSCRKVCILTSVHPVFDGRIFNRQAKTLLRAGYDIVLIAQHEQNETVDGVKIVALPKALNRISRMLGSLRVFFIALKQSADIFHFHDPELLPVCALLKLLTGKKVIYDVHEHYPNSIIDKYWIPRPIRVPTSHSFMLMEKLLVPLLDAVVYTTPLVGERYQEMPVKTVRVENVPSLEMFNGFVSNPANAKEKFILHLGGMSKIRGILELIEAFSIVTRSCPELYLYFVGKATPESFKKTMREMISKFHIEDRVRMLRHVPYEKIRDYLSEAYLGVVNYLPYSNNVSCLPNKLLEYMACGLPVVASNFPLYKEVVEGAGYGILVDPTSPEDIAEAICRIVEDDNLRENLSKNAVKAFKEKYNWESESKKLLDLYRGVCIDL
jgi:glycosyltransferase involved in cell wall biosynthesis